MLKSRFVKIFVLLVLLLSSLFLFFFYFSDNLGINRSFRTLSDTLDSKFGKDKDADNTAFGSVVEEYASIYEDPQKLAPNKWGFLDDVDNLALKLRVEGSENSLLLVSLGDKVWLECTLEGSDADKYRDVTIDYSGVPANEIIKNIQSNFQSSQDVAKMLGQYFIGENLRYSSREIVGGGVATDHIIIWGAKTCSPLYAN